MEFLFELKQLATAIMIASGIKQTHSVSWKRRTVFNSHKKKIPVGLKMTNSYSLIAEIVKTTH